MPFTVAPGGYEQRGKSIAGQRGAAPRDQYLCCLVPPHGDLRPDDFTLLQSGRDNRCRRDDLARAEPLAQVSRILSGLTEDRLQGLATRGLVLTCKPSEQAEPIVVIERTRSPGSHGGRYRDVSIIVARFAVTRFNFQSALRTWLCGRGR